MIELPLRRGPLHANGCEIRSSGMHWLRASGDVCEAHQVVAYAHLSVTHDGAPGRSVFTDDHDLYVACAVRVGGRLRIDARAGGYVSMLGTEAWDADAIVGSLAVEDAAQPLPEDASIFRLLLLAGRRATMLADLPSGLLSSWYERSRAWWSDGAAPVTLLSLGICDVTGVVSGERRAFFELFRSEPEPTHAVFIPDHPLAPAAPVLLDRLERSPADAAAVASDLREAIARGPADANDLIFAGSLVAAMQRDPIRAAHDLLLPSGFERGRPADAVLLSLSAEPPVIRRHKKFGYRLHLLNHHQRAAGPAVSAWLAQSFEAVTRSVDDIKTDYERLFDAIERATGALPIVLNRMSTSGDETLSNYAAFDAPLGRSLAHVEAKELNLMLDDLAAERDLAIVDVDAIAADIGGAKHLPDGIHQSGTMQAILREEILRALRPLRARTAPAAVVT